MITSRAMQRHEKVADRAGSLVTERVRALIETAQARADRVQRNAADEAHRLDSQRMQSASRIASQIGQLEGTLGRLRQQMQSDHAVEGSYVDEGRLIDAVQEREVDAPAGPTASTATSGSVTDAVEEPLIVAETPAAVGEPPGEGEDPSAQEVEELAAEVQELADEVKSLKAEVEERTAEADALSSTRQEASAESGEAGAAADDPGFAGEEALTEAEPPVEEAPVEAHDVVPPVEEASGEAGDLGATDAEAPMEADDAGPALEEGWMAANDPGPGLEDASIKPDPEPETAEFEPQLDRDPAPEVAEPAGMEEDPTPQETGADAPGAEPAAPGEGAAAPGDAQRSPFSFLRRGETRAGSGGDVPDPPPEQATQEAYACAVCGRGFAGNEEELRSLGWVVSESGGVTCSDCHSAGWLRPT